MTSQQLRQNRPQIDQLHNRKKLNESQPHTTHLRYKALTTSWQGILVKDNLQLTTSSDQNPTFIKASVETYKGPRCNDSGNVKCSPSTLPCFDVREEPLCLPPRPLADLLLPADRTLNIASPPVKIVWRTGPSSKPCSDWAMITMGTWLISSPLRA